MATSATGAGTIGRADLEQNIPPGVLTHVSLTTDDPTLGFTDLHVTITIIAVNGDESTPLYVITDGYLSIDTPIRWFGFIALDDSALIHVELVGLRLGLWNLNYRRLTLNNATALQNLLKEIQSV
jgi:hypothetical protein